MTNATTDEAEALHLSASEVAAYAEDVTHGALLDSMEIDGEMVADFIFDLAEPDKHGRVIGETYRAIIVAAADLVIAQRKIVSDEIDASAD